VVRLDEEEPLRPPDDVADDVGLHQVVYAIGMTTGPWLGGIIAQGLGLRPMFGITAVL
jgi:predicted MFS family arabinose efflux permease